MKEHSKAFIETLRERLHRYAYDKGKTNDSLVQEILDCPAVKLSTVPTRKALTRGQRWDSGQPLTVESLRRFLQSDENSSFDRREAYREFLQFHNYLADSELGSGISNYEYINEIQTPSYLESRKKLLGELASTEMVRRKETSRSIELMLFKLPHAEVPSLFTELHVLSFQRTSAETTDAFLNRVREGKDGKLFKWVAQIVPYEITKMMLCFTSIGEAIADPVICSIFPNNRNSLLEKFPLASAQVSPKRKLTLLCQVSQQNLQIFIKNSNIDDKSMYSDGPLYEDEIEFDEEEINDLISKYGMTKSDNKDSNYSLVDAAKEISVSSIIEAMINGADINEQDSETGMTAAHICAERHDREALAILYPKANDFEAVLSNPEYNLASLGAADDVKESWKSALKLFDPLVRDNKGRLPSSHYPMITPEAFADPRLSDQFDLAAITEMHSRMISLEIAASESKGIDAMQFYENYTLNRLQPISSRPIEEAPEIT